MVRHHRSRPCALADAWFDVCTSPPGLDRLLASGEAVLVELPLSAAAIWLAVSLSPVRTSGGAGR
jgi:hypothetical protein